MKAGKSLVELASEIQSIKDNSKDYIVPTERLEMTLKSELLPEPKSEWKTEPVLTFTNGEEKSFALNSWSGSQLATYTNIPKPYYDRISVENSALLCENVNHGLRMQAAESSRNGKPENRMLRTYKGNIRGFVSSSYRRLDCYDLLSTVLPVVKDNGFELISSELTDRRMYLQLTTPRITSMVKVGDVVQYGLTISSSDVGSGSVRVEPLVYRLRCTNGMILSSAIKKMHIGRDLAGDDIQELLSEETLNITDQAFWKQVRDVVVATMDQKYFDNQVGKLRLAADNKIENFNIPEVVELASKTVGVTSKSLKEIVAGYLANGADGAGLTQWGLANAFTFAANHDSVSYDDSVELERVGAKIIDLNKSQWKVIAAA